MKGLNSKESILAPYWRSQLIDSRNCKDLSDNDTGFELEKRYVELRLMCDVSLMWYRKTTQWHGASFDSLTAPDKKGHKTCKITTIFQTVVDR